MVSSPPSLKRTRTSKVLEEKGFEINWGKWTIVEACLLETVESFLCTTNVLPTYQNITKLYNFVANSNCASHLNLTVNPKTEKQVLGKLNLKHSRHGALENLFYGLSQPNVLIRSVLNQFRFLKKCNSKLLVPISAF